MMKKRLIIFIPSIEGGGVEKNMFIVSNYLSQKIKVSVVTISKKFQNKLSKNINFITLKSNLWDKTSRRFKYFLSLLLLIYEISKDKKLVVFSFQANIYCIILCKIFNIKIIVRANSAPIGWTNNLFKKKYSNFLLIRLIELWLTALNLKKTLKTNST